MGSAVWLAVLWHRRTSHLGLSWMIKARHLYVGTMLSMAHTCKHAGRQNQLGSMTRQFSPSISPSPACSTGRANSQCKQRPTTYENTTRETKRLIMEECAGRCVAQIRVTESIHMNSNGLPGLKRLRVFFARKGRDEDR